MVKETNLSNKFDILTSHSIWEWLVPEMLHLQRMLGRLESVAWLGKCVMTASSHHITPFTCPGLLASSWPVNGELSSCFPMHFNEVQFPWHGGGGLIYGTARSRKKIRRRDSILLVFFQILFQAITFQLRRDLIHQLSPVLRSNLIYIHGRCRKTWVPFSSDCDSYSAF